MSKKQGSSRTIPGLLAAAAAGLMLAAGSTTANASDARGVAVSYGDLDLGRDAGVQALYGRLRAAAGSVCGRDELRDLHRHEAWLECRDAALARAVDALGNAKLAALHRGMIARDS